MATFHLVTQRPPLREITWLKFWTCEVATLAGNRSNNSHGSSYNETG